MFQTLFNWLAVIAYSGLVIYIGMRIRRADRGQASDDRNLEFWLAKRQLPGWRLGISLTSGWLMLGWIGFGMAQVYMYGATGLWILAIPWFILCWIIIAIVPFVRRIGAVSLPQAIEKRFGVSARTLVAIFSFFVFLSWTQAELFMAGSLMSGLLNVKPWVCMIVLVVPIIAYTSLGGFRAIVTTDLVQFLIMAVFMAILAVTAIHAASAAGGGAMVEAVRAATPPWSGSGEVFNPWFLGVLFPVVLLLGYLPGWVIEQDLTLRIQAAKSTREARKGAILGLALISIFIIVLPNLAAFCALVVYPPADGAPPAAIGGDATGIISAFIAGLPAILQVFMLLGLVACQMSTVDTFSNVSAMPLAYDLIGPSVSRVKLRNGQSTALARFVSVFVIVLALGCALFSEKLGDVYYLSSGVLSASIAVPAFFIFWKRTTLPAVLVASVAGFVGTLGMYVYEYKYLQSADADAAHYYMNELPTWLHAPYGYLYLAAGVLSSAVLIVVVSLLTERSPESRLANVKPSPVDDFETFVDSV